MGRRERGLFTHTVGRGSTKGFLSARETTIGTVIFVCESENPPGSFSMCVCVTSFFADKPTSFELLLGLHRLTKSSIYIYA